jgi:hypothetical protein
MLKYNKNNLDSLSNQYNEKDLKDKLNLKFLDLINKTTCVGLYDMPKVLSPSHVNIDYLALYSDKHDYNKTSNTCVCFYEYDKVFDSKNSLFNAIYYNDIKLLNKYKERFKDVLYFISPDYSLCGDMPETINIYNIFKSRFVSLGLTLLFDKLVIPNITYASRNSFNYMLDGLEDCYVVAFSTKGSLKDKEQKELLLEAIEYSVDHLHNLKQIVIYDVSIDNSRTLELFNYPTTKGIEVMIPNNLLKERNIILGGKLNG